MTRFRQEVEEIMREMEEHVSPSIGWMSVFYSKLQQACRREDRREELREEQAVTSKARWDRTQGNIQRILGRRPS
jgi:hypothetical protein